MLLPSRSDSPPGTPSRKRKDSANTARKTASGMVEYNGTLVDIGKLMDQLSRSEHTRVETEKSLAKLRTDYNKLKESSARSERYIKDLTADIKDYKERLYNSNSELCTVEEVWRGPKYSAVFVEIKFGIGKKKWLIDINFFNLVLKIIAECEEIVLYLRDLTV
uniref:Uncharacterized protein n=1 Tax=Rhodnius prolixus TaxID=13249 RepID=T1HC96_RHOPR